MAYATDDIVNYIKQMGHYKPIDLLQTVMTDGMETRSKKSICATRYGDMFMYSFRDLIQRMFADPKSTQVLVSMPKKLLLAQEITQVQQAFRQLLKEAIESKDEGLDESAVKVIVLEGWVARIQAAIIEAATISPPTDVASPSLSPQKPTPAPEGEAGLADESKQIPAYKVPPQFVHHP